MPQSWPPPCPGARPPRSRCPRRPRQRGGTSPVRGPSGAARRTRTRPSRCPQRRGPPPSRGPAPRAARTRGSPRPRGPRTGRGRRPSGGGRTPPGPWRRWPGARPGGVFFTDVRQGRREVRPARRAPVAPHPQDFRARVGEIHLAGIRPVLHDIPGAAPHALQVAQPHDALGVHRQGEGGVGRQAEDLPDLLVQGRPRRPREVVQVELRLLDRLQRVFEHAPDTYPRDIIILEPGLLSRPSKTKIPNDVTRPPRDNLHTEGDEWLYQCNRSWTRRVSS